MSLEGKLSELALADLIEITALGAKTGVLSITNPDGTPAGQLSFRAGRLTSATAGALEGERAFYMLLGLKQGGFTFDSGSDPGDAAIDLPTGSLLMEAMRRIDEIGFLRDSVPAPARLALLGGKPEDKIEAMVLGFLGPGGRLVGDIVDGALIEGTADEYEVLRAITRLQARGVVRLLAEGEDPLQR